MSNFKGLKLTAGCFAMLLIAASTGQAEDVSNKSLGNNTNSVSHVGHRKSNCPSGDCNVEYVSEKAFNREVRKSNRGVGIVSDGHTSSGYCENCKSSRRFARDGSGKSFREGGGRCPNCRSGNCRGRCRFSPGHGWRVPGYRPVERDGVGYTKYWPNYWSGNGPGSPVPAHPVVYTPTDTTQLGYYYNQVPSWQPIPGMLPQAPVPSQYHDRSIQYNHRNHFWGNYDEDHKWRHRVQYSKAASGHQEPVHYNGLRHRGHHNSGVYNDGAIHSTCPTCQPQHADSNYPTPVDKGKEKQMPVPIPEPTKSGS